MITEPNPAAAELAHRLAVATAEIERLQLAHEGAEQAWRRAATWNDELRVQLAEARALLALVRGCTECCAILDAAANPESPRLAPLAMVEDRTPEQLIADGDEAPRAAAERAVLKAMGRAGQSTLLSYQQTPGWLGDACRAELALRAVKP